MAKPTKTCPVQGSKKTSKKNEAFVNAGTSVNLMKTAKSGTVFKKWLGTAKGNFIVPDDFNDPLPKEIEDLFYKGSVFPDVINRIGASVIIYYSVIIAPITAFVNAI